MSLEREGIVRRERSALSVPATSWRMIEKAVASAADVVFIDLEDSVAPSAKVEARQNVIRAMRELDWGTRPRAYRVNGLDTSFFHHDVIHVMEAVGDALDVIVVPKVARPEDLAFVDTLLTQLENSLSLEAGSVAFEAQIESAKGLVNVERIAEFGSSSGQRRLRALIFGPGDFAASMRMPATSIGSADEWDAQYPGHRFHYAMARIVTAARAFDVRAMDGPSADYRDGEGYRRSAIIARGLGYDGKWCIHPSQIPVANAVFSPTEDEVAWARKVVDAYKAATEAGSGVITVDERMIDAASIRMAMAALESQA